MKGDVRLLSQHACGSSPSDGDCHPFFLFLSVTALYRKHSVKPNAAYFVENRNLDATENDSFKPDSGFIQMKKEHSDHSAGMQFSVCVEERNSMQFSVCVEERNSLQEH